MKNLYPIVALFLLTLGWSFPAAAQAPVHKQTRSKIVNSAAASINLDFSAASTPGNLILVHLTWDKQSRDVNTVTDTKSNVYYPIGSATNWGGGSYRSQLFYAYKINAGTGAISITATLNGAVNSLFEMYISEYSNVLTTADPLDKTLINAGSGSSVTSGSVATTATNELIYGVAIGKSVPLGSGTGFNVRSSDQDNIVEDKSSTAVGSYGASFTGAGNWIVQVATFKSMVTLPVSLVSFDATVIKENKVQLNWATATESNSDHFEVEHSHDGQEWTAIGQIDAAGTSTTTLQYSFVDENPYAGVGYYRLKQVDRDGKATISKTVTVHIDEAPVATIRIYPNPAISTLFVEGAAQAISVFNTAGQRMSVRVNAQGDSKALLDVSSLPKGAYFVKAGEKSMLFLRQ